MGFAMIGKRSGKDWRELRKLSGRRKVSSVTILALWQCCRSCTRNMRSRKRLSWRIITRIIAFREVAIISGCSGCSKLNVKISQLSAVWKTRFLYWLLRWKRLRAEKCRIRKSSSRQCSFRFKTISSCCFSSKMLMPSCNRDWIRDWAFSRITKNYKRRINKYNHRTKNYNNRTMNYNNRTKN